MNSKQKINFEKFERLTKDSHVLKGGFSNAFGGNVPSQDLTDPTTNTCTNNCFGGNCTATCGKK